MCHGLRSSSGKMSYGRKIKKDGQDRIIVQQCFWILITFWTILFITMKLMLGNKV